MQHYYTAYGLVLQSSFQLPELEPIDPDHADIVVRFGTVPVALDEVTVEGVLYQANAEQFLLKLDTVGSYLVQHGHEVIVQPAQDSRPEDVRLFFLGSCLGALLQQRGILPLHASCIQTEHGAVAFVGPSGIGKSTLLVTFLDRGYKMLADDVTGIMFVEESKRAVVLPAVPRLKLWHDVIERLGEAPSALTPVRPEANKYSIPALESFAGEPIDLYKLYVLRAHNKPEIEITPLTQLAAFRAIAKQTYRRTFLTGRNIRQSHFHLVTAVTRQAEISLVKRPAAPFYQINELADQLESDFG